MRNSKHVCAAIFFTIAACFNLPAQTVRLKITDSSGIAVIPFASARIADPVKKTVLATAYAKQDGLVELKAAKEGEYLLIVGMVQYQEKIIPVTLSAGKTTELSISLNRFHAKKLEEVTVTGKRPMIQPATGGYTFNVDPTIIALNSDAGQLLKKLPGVFWDQNNKLKLMDKEVVLWVDGKPLTLSNDDLEGFLRSLNTADIKNIKVYTTPPSIYSSAGSGGVIELITNKNIINGLTGRVTAGMGNHDKNNAGLAFNYRSKAYSGSYRFTYDRINFFQSEYNDQQNTDIGSQLSRYTYNTKTKHRPIDTRSIQLQNDFAFNPESVLGIMLRYNGYHLNPSGTKSRLDIFDNQGQLNEMQEFTREDENKSSVYFGNINYRKSWKKGTGNFIADFYIWDRVAGARYDQRINRLNQSNQVIGLPDIRVNNTNVDVKGKSLSLSTAGKLHDSLNFTYGLRMDQYDILTGLFTNYLPAGNGFGFKTDSANTYTLSYQEKVLATFINFAGNYKWLQYNVGLRVEATGLGIDVARFSEKSHNKRSFTNAFPSVSIVFPVRKLGILSLGYGKRINRVSYSQLYPLDMRRSAAVIVRGNPNLLPSLSDNVNASLTINKNPKRTFMLAGGWTKYHRPYSWFLLPAPEQGKFIYSPLNHKAWTFYNVNLYQQHKISEKTVITCNLFTSRQIYDISDILPVETTPVNVFGGNISLVQRFWKTAGVEIYGNYKTPSGTPFGKGYGFKHVDITFFKTFAKNTITASIKINDVFDINKAEYDNISPAYANTGYIKNETRYVRATFSYRFGVQRNNRIKDYTPQEDTRLSGE